MPFYTMPDQEQLYVRRIGHGKPVLVLSGLGMSSWQWLPCLVPSLTKRQFFIPDFRGFGKSKDCKIPEGLTAIESHWRDVEALLKHLDFERIDVIGYSMGATTTMHGLTYGNFEQYIDKYMHIDQTAKIRNSENDWNFGLYGENQERFLHIIKDIYIFLEKQQHHQYLNQLPREQKKELTTLWIKFAELQGNSELIKKIAKIDYFSEIQPRLIPLQRIDYILWYLNTYLNHDEDYRKALVALKRPTEFIIGQNSTLYSSEGQIELAKKLENSTIHLMRKSGHVPLAREPFKFTKVLNQFLQQ